MLSAFFQKIFPGERKLARVDALVIQEFSIPFLNASGQAMALFNAKGVLAFKTKIFAKKFPEISSIEDFQETITSEDLEDFKFFSQEAFLGHSSKKNFSQKEGKMSQHQKISIEIIPLTEGYTIWRFEDISSFDKGQQNILQKNTFEKSQLPQVLLNSEAEIQGFNIAFKSLIEKEKDVSNFKDLLSPTSGQQIFSQGQAWEKFIHDSDSSRFELSLENHPNRVFQAYASRIDEQSYLLQLIDYTEQKNFHLKMLQSQKLQAMGELAGGIAHDFNNLLTAIIGFCDLLLLRHSPGDQSFTDIMQIKQNANRAANLVRQLLAFSKQQTLQPKPLNVTEHIADLTPLLGRLVGAAITLNVRHERDLWPIKVDQSQFEQVIINLVVNARDAIGEKPGTISVTTHNEKTTQPIYSGSEKIMPGDYVVIEVKDDGCGIEEKDLPRIFDPFFSSKAEKGTGLGLATVYGITLQMGGLVQVETSKESGTTFRILLPRNKKIRGQQSSTPSNDTLQHDNREKEQDTLKDLTGTANILFVEDEDAVRLFGVRALRDKGYRVIEAHNGEEAWEYITSEGRLENIDLIITDVVMPIMDGPTLIEKVSQLTQDLKVLFISGYAEDDFRQKVNQDENIHFLAKPFSLKALALKVKSILEQENSAKKEKKKEAC